MEPDIGSELRFLPSQPAFNAPVRRLPSVGPRQNIAVMINMDKLEWCGYLTVKNSEHTITRFDIIHKHDGWTGRHRMTAQAMLA